jgi:hypothetical protein
MQKVKRQEDTLETLVRLFMEATIVFDSKWRGKEIPPLHRLFPKDIINMFKIWYKERDEGDGGDMDIILNKSQFISYFEKILIQKKIRYEHIPSKSSYCLSQGEYKYKFSNLRLTTQGLEIYIKLLPY